MGQNWKTLVIVIVGAAIAGWATVRFIGSGRRERVVVQTAAVASPLAAATIAVAATAVPLPTAAPASAPAADLPPAGDEADETALIERDLGLLAQALVKDQRVADRFLPRINDVLDVPGTTQYRRAPDFWEPALSPAGEMKP